MGCDRVSSPSCFVRLISVTEEQLSSSNILLVCDGLDTVASISVNGKRIGESRNMFVRYEFDLKKALKVSVTFHSVFTMARHASHVTVG